VQACITPTPLDAAPLSFLDFVREFKALFPQKSDDACQAAWDREEKRLAREAEAEAEEKRLAREAEAEEKRLAREAEEKRLAREAEEKRLAREAETQRLQCEWIEWLVGLPTEKRCRRLYAHAFSLPLPLLACSAGGHQDKTACHDTRRRARFVFERATTSRDEGTQRGTSTRCGCALVAGFFFFFFLLPPALIHTFGLKYPEMLCLASDHPAIIHTTASLHHHRSLRAPLGGRDGPHCASVLFSAATGQRGRLGDP
jgi:hypothetical protein